MGRSAERSVRGVRRARRALLAVLGAFLLAALAAPALADAPSNDNRADAAKLTPPAHVSGTTQDATVESDEPSSGCGLGDKNSVWYGFDSPGERRALVQLHAAGDLDAVVSVYRRTRSQTSVINCDATDKDGNAGVSFRAAKDQSYLVRVAQRSNSVSGTFTLDVLLPEAPPTPPGKPLPARGVISTLDRLVDQADAWAVDLRQGRSYRINLASRTENACPSLDLFPPGTTSFEDASPVASSRCSYRLFTPGAGAGGTYSIRVSADQGYR